MANIAFFYNNLWKEFDISPSTQHPNFPAIQTQHRDLNKYWHSLHGAGSGWGQFVIINGINDRIDFNEGGGELTANLTPGTHDADTLCAHLKTIMEAAGAHTYTWEYLESGASKNKFRCTDETGVVAFPWNSGTNGTSGTGRTVGDTLGYDTSGDAIWAASHTALYIRIHTSESLTIDLEAITDIYGMIIRGHNLQDTAVAKVYGSNDNFATTPLNKPFTVQANFLVKIWKAAQKYRYWANYFEDIDNPAGYIKAGFVFLGERFQPTRNFVRGPVKPTDQSVIKKSDNGQIISLQKPRYKTKTYIFEGTDQFDEFDAMFEAVGTSRQLFVVENPDTPLTTVRYIQFTNWSWDPIPTNGIFWNLTISYMDLV